MPTKEENKMGKWGATSYIIGNIVGSGIFITPASILRRASSVGVALIIWAVSAFIATLGAYCYVELGTSIRKSGADFAYLCHVKWKAIALAFMFTTCVLTYPCTLAVQAETFSQYIIQGIGIEYQSAWHKFVLQKLIGFSIIWLLLYLNFFSLHIFVARFQMAASFTKIAATGLIIVTGAYVLFVKRDTHNLEAPFKNTTLDPGNITSAFFSGLFSYDGWDILNIGAEEVENPRMVMSFAILVGMSAVAGIFLAVNLAYFAVLSVAEIKQSDAVAMTFAKQTLGPFQHLMPFLVSILLIGSLNGTIFASSRYLLAASRERQFPAFLSCINPKHDSPRAALFIHILLAMIFSFLGDLEQLIDYLAFVQWIQRCFTMTALLYIRFCNKPVHPGAIRTPIIMPIFFFLLCTTLLRASMGLLFLAIGYVFYLLFIWEHSLQRFDWYQRWANFANCSLCIGTQVIFNGIIDLADEDEEEEGLEGQGLEDESLPKSEKANGNILQFGNSRISPTDKLYEESAHPNPPPAAVDQANSDHLISIVVNDDRYSSSAKKDE